MSTREAGRATVAPEAEEAVASAGVAYTLNYTDGKLSEGAQDASSVPPRGADVSAVAGDEDEAEMAGRLKAAMMEAVAAPLHVHASTVPVSPSPREPVETECV